jgi:hypothetical protein
MAYSGWEISEKDRATLMGIMGAAYPDVIAHHITLRPFVRKDDPDELPPEVVAEAVGWADNGVGVQAIVVAINGSTKRPDGRTYHITWSINRAAGYKPVDSNRVIELGWNVLFEPVPLTVTPKIFS